jgi:hypothetical protein
MLGIVADAGAIDAQRPPALDLERPGVGTQVDREAAAAGRLAADRAIAKLVGVGCVALNFEGHRVATA